jgi:pimeloyl-ACP methyl ester carboxylesterase
MHQLSITKPASLASRGLPPTYKEYGERSSFRPSIVCIHGAFQAQQCFTHLYEALVQQGSYHVIGVDLPGHGQAADIPHQLLPTPDLWSRYLREILEDADLLGHPLVFCAWSLGASVVRNSLLEYGLDEVAGLILIAPAFGMEHCLEHLQDHPETLEAFSRVGTIFDLNRSLFARHEAFTTFFKHLTAHPLAQKEDDASYGSNERAFWRLSSLGSEYLMQDRAGDTTALLKSITVPTLLIHGMQDTLIPVSYAHLLAETLPQATLCLYECGHSPMVEQPAQMNLDVLSFLLTHIA